MKENSNNDITEDEMIDPEINSFDYTLRPALDSFITNPNMKPLNICYYSLVLNLEKLINNVVPFSFLENLKEKRIVAASMKNAQLKKQEQIKKTVRSYKNSFTRFNKEATCLDTNKEGNYVRERK